MNDCGRGKRENSGEKANESEIGGGNVN